MRARFLSAKLLAAGSIIPFDTTGIDFAMTALFAVPVVEQWKTHKKSHSGHGGIRNNRCGRD